MHSLLAELATQKCSSHAGLSQGTGSVSRSLCCGSTFQQLTNPPRGRAGGAPTHWHSPPPPSPECTQASPRNGCTSAPAPPQPPNSTRQGEEGLQGTLPDHTCSPGSYTVLSSPGATATCLLQAGPAACWGRRWQQARRTASSRCQFHLRHFLLQGPLN